MLSAKNKEEKSKKINIQIQKQSISYVFRYDIQKVFDFIKDFEETEKALPEIQSGVNFICGSKTYEKGCVFTYYYRKVIKMFLELAEIKESENEKSLIFKITKSEPIDIQYELTYRLLRLTTENNATLLIWDINYCTPITISNEELAANDKERCEVLLLFAKYLSKKHGNCFQQTETIIIYTSFKNVFKALTNVNIFIKLLPCNITKFELDGEFNKQGTNLLLECNNGEQLYQLTVEKAEVNKDKSEFEFCIAVNQDVAKNKQRVCNKMLIKLLKISDAECFMGFTHFFDFKIEQEMVKKIVNDKKNVMLELKKSFDVIKNRKNY